MKLSIIKVAESLGVGKNRNEDVPEWTSLQIIICRDLFSTFSLH